MGVTLLYNPFKTVTNDLFMGDALYPVAVTEQLWDKSYDAYATMKINRLCAEMALWFNNNNIDVYHTTRNGKLVMDTKNGEDPNPNHLFYFRKGDDAKRFMEILPSFTTGAKLFDHLEAGYQERIPLSAAIMYIMPDDGSEKHFNLWAWCRNNLADKVYILANTNMLFFASDADSVMFHLKHVGATT